MLFKKYYYVKSDGTDFNPQAIEDLNIEAQRSSADEYIFNMTAADADIIKGWSNVKSVNPYIRPVN